MNDNRTATQQPATAKLERQFSVAPYGGDAVEVADINGDGKPELLILQSPGQCAAQLMADRSDLDEVDRRVFCLTAVDLTGSVLWQLGRPYDRPFPYNSHGVQGGHLLAIADLDANGTLDIVTIRGSELLVIEGRTGRIKRSTRLPADNFMMVATAQLGPPEQGRQILCKVNDLAYEPWDYGNPMMVFNANLTVRHEPFSVRGAGHNFVIRDIDGDGRDEIFVGYSLLDHDGRPIWRLDLGKDFDYAGEHADHIGLSDIDDDGKLEIRYAGSEDFLVCDTDGAIRWTLSAGHSQRSIHGCWPGGEPHLIVLAEKNAGLTGIRADGKRLWNRTDINGYVVAHVRWPDRDGLIHRWGVFRPQLPAIQPTPYHNDPAWSAGLWPRLMDATGDLHDVLPWSDAYAHPVQRIRSPLSYDCGLKYYPVAVDLKGRGVDDMLVYDRHRVWLFTVA